MSRFTILLIALNLITAYWLLFKSNAPESEQVDQAPLLELDIALIDSLKIERPDNTIIRLSRSGSSWSLDKPVAWPANDEVITVLLTNVKFLKINARFTINPETNSLKQYGLDEPLFSLSLSENNETQLLHFGNAGSDKFLYIYDPERSIIFVADPSELNAVPTDISALRDSKIFTLPIFEIDRFSIQFREPDVTVRLALNGDTWMFESPITANADATRVKKLLNMLASLQVLEFEEDIDDPARFSLETPNMKIRMGANEKWHSLVLGAHTETVSGGTASVYAKRDDFDSVFILNESPFMRIREDWEQLRWRRFFEYDSDAVSTIELTGLDKQITIQKLETGPWQAVAQSSETNVRTEPADVSIITPKLNSLASVEALEFISDAPSEEDLERYGLNNPNRSFTVKGESEKTLLIGEWNENGEWLYAKTKEDNSVYGISPDILATWPVDILSYKDKMLSILPESARVISAKLTHNGKAGASWKKEEDDDNELPDLVTILKALTVAEYFPGKPPEATFPWELTYEVALPGGDEMSVSSRTIKLTSLKADNSTTCFSAEHNLYFKPTSAFSDAIDAFNKSMKKNAPNEPDKQ